MSSGYQDIEILLDQLFILDYVFRMNLKVKLPTLSEEQLQRLRKTLEEILHIQKQKISQKITAHLEVAEEFLSVIKTSDTVLLSSFKDSLVLDDKNKIEELTKNINNL